MSDFGFYSFSEPFKPGIDFRTSDDALTINVSINTQSNVVISITKIAFANISLSSESNVSIAVRKLVYAESVIVVDGATLTVGTRVKLASVSIAINSNIQFSVEGIRFTSVSISADSLVLVQAKQIHHTQISISSISSVDALIKKDALGSSVIAATSSISTVAQLVKLISASLSGNVNLTVVGKVVLITIKIVINNLGQVAARAIKFSVGNVISASDLSDIRTVLLIDDKPITNHNRKLSVAVDPIFVENTNWNNRKSRYYKYSSRPARKTFSLSWTYVPNSQSYTVDGNRGRDYLKEIAGKPQHHVLKIINMDENGAAPYTETSYNVLVKDYSETLIRRDLVDDIYFWDCSISLEEV
jgi:hypothetical protein